jgi:hypothetical protein
MLAGQPQGDGGSEPNDQSGANEAHVHNMNQNSYSHTLLAGASTKLRAAPADWHDCRDRLTITFNNSISER